MLKIKFKEWEEEKMNKEQEVWNKFLESATDEDLFMSVVTYNYDSVSSSSPLIEKILSDSSVDKAIALALYWRLGPRYLKQFKTISEIPEWCEETYQICAQIENHFLNNFYTTSELYYNPKNDDMENWTTDYLEYDPQHTLPEIMEAEIVGTKIVEDSHDFFRMAYPLNL